MSTEGGSIVIGAGVTGLTLGWALQRAGRVVRILEKNATPGGAVRTVRRDGYLAESGPNSLLVNSGALESLLKGIGMGAQMQKPQPEAKRRYILKDGEFVAAPMGAAEVFSTPLWSGRGKLRVLGDLFAKAPEKLVEESLARFVKRHFGPEILDYAVNPFVGGIYAGNPSKLSAQHAFPMLADAEREAGSVIRGMIKQRKARKARGEAFKSYSLSFKDGMQALTDTLAQRLGNKLACGASVQSIEQMDAGWRVAWTDAGGVSHAEEAAELYLTTPAFALADLPLPDNVSAALSPLADIEYPPVASVALGYDRANVTHALDGFGGLIPEVERRRALGVLFSSSLFAGRAPEGKTLLTVFIGGSRQPELAEKSADEIRAIAECEVNQLLGVTGDPEFAEVTTWPRAIPQYNVGYGQFVSAMEQAEKQFPGLRLMGNYRGGIAVGNCLVNAATAVEPIG
ncbi:MAG: protoporphyrinogen oxidase [Puniceicoccales bacterium]